MEAKIRLILEIKILGGYMGHLDWIYPGMWSTRSNVRQGYNAERKILHIKRLDLPEDLQNHIISIFKEETLKRRYRNIYFPEVMRQLMREADRFPYSQSCPVLYLLSKTPPSSPYGVPSQVPR